MKPYSHYKDSGIDWLGRIPNHWEVKRIKFIAELNRSTLPESTDGDFEFYYIDIGSVTLGNISADIPRLRFEDAPSRARRITSVGDTLVSTVRTYLKAIATVDLEYEDLIASTGFAVLTPTYIEKRFFSYLMMSEHVIDTISSQSVGVGYPAINASDIADIPICFPKQISEQNEIADYLDKKTAEIDDIIAKKQRLIKLLEEERAAVISTAVTQGLDPDVPKRPSGIPWLGDIPAHWQKRRLKYLADFRSGNSITAESISDHSDYPVFGGNGIRGYVRR